MINASFKSFVAVNVIVIQGVPTMLFEIKIVEYNGSYISKITTNIKGV